MIIRVRYVNTVYGVDLPIDNHKFVDLLQREFLQHPLYKYRSLKKFFYSILKHNQFRDYAKDILIRKGSIIASRLFIPLRGINTTNR